MAGGGRRRRSTEAQRAEVRRLAASGLSIRVIAVRVFGDAQCRGRVERILSGPDEVAPSQEATEAQESEACVFAGLSRSGQLRWLFERRLVFVAARDEPPSAGELRALLDVDRRLSSLEQFERLQALTRRDPAV